MKNYEAGALFGLILGAIGGTLIPLTVIIYNNWNYAEKQKLEEIRNRLEIEEILKWTRIFYNWIIIGKYCRA